MGGLRKALRSRGEAAPGSRVTLALAKLKSPRVHVRKRSAVVEHDGDRFVVTDPWGRMFCTSADSPQEAEIKAIANGMRGSLTVERQ